MFVPEVPAVLAFTLKSTGFFKQVRAQTPHSGVLPVQRPSENTRAAATQLFMLKISTWGYLQTLPVVSPFNIIQ